MRRAIPAILFCAVLFAEPIPLIFKGNTSLSDSALYDSLGLRKPYPVEVWESPPSIEPDAMDQSISALTSFYRSKGYYHTRILPEKTDKAITLTIQENNPIRIGDVKINSSIDVDTLVTLRVDDVFDQDTFSAVKGAIKKRYAQSGYCNAQFNSKAWVDIETDRAYLLFEATPGEPCTFGTVTVESTPNVEGKLAASMLTFKEGDPYSVESIRQSYESLYAQEALTRVMINDNERNGSVVPVSVAIEEDERPIRFTAGLGFSSDQGLSAQTGIKHRNFFGDLKTLSLDFLYNQTLMKGSGTFTAPFDNRGTFSAEAGYADEIFDGYKTQSIYEKLTLSYQEAPLGVLGGILFDRSQTYDSQDTDAFPDSLLFIASPFAEINYDTRDKPLDPTKGYWLNGRLTGSLYNPLFSDASYYKALLSGAYIASLSDHVFAAKLKWGTLHVYEGSIPSSYRFYAGGMNSNRAYTYRDLGPKNSSGDPVGFSSLTEGTLEYRFPIYGDFRGVLFTDVTFASDNIVPDYGAGAYWGVGYGLRYVTPVGPVAFDFGIDPEDTSQYAFHFRIGELF